MAEEEGVMLSAKEAIRKLEEGNKRYLSEKTGSGDISPAIRLRTCRDGQHPFAIIIACSDSRVIPESIFSVGIGDLFVIRLAGNVEAGQLQIYHCRLSFYSTVLLNDGHHRRITVCRRDQEVSILSNELSDACRGKYPSDALLCKHGS